MDESPAKPPAASVGDYMRPETMVSTTVGGLLISQFSERLTDIPTVAALAHPFAIGLFLSFTLATAVIWQAEKRTGMTFVAWLIAGIALFNSATGSYTAKQAVLPSEPIELSSPVEWFASSAFADEIAQRPWFPPEPTPKGE